MTPLDIARLQVGIREWPTSSNRVVYNTWYYGREVYGADYPWCMVFVQWCHAMAGTPLPFRTASCSALLGWYRNNAPECVASKPTSGAIVIYNGHTGIVETVNSDGTFTAIEGNTSVTNMANGGEVQRVRRSLQKVVAFIVPDVTSETYTVKSGDTLSGIAAKYGTTVKALVEINKIANPDRLSIGQKIKIGRDKHE